MHISRIQEQHGSRSYNMVFATAKRAHDSAIHDTNCGNTMEVFCELVFLIGTMKEFDLTKIYVPPEARTLPMVERFLPMIGLYFGVGPDEERVGSKVKKGLTLMMPLRIHIKK